MNAPREIFAAPSPDATSIRGYCDILFGYLDGLVPVRLFPEAGTSAQRPQLQFLAPEAVANRITAMAHQAAERQQGVFVVPGTVDEPGSAKARDIIQTGVLVVDLDDGDIPAKAAHLLRYLGPPTLEVASGGVTADGHVKLHLYWRLTEAASGEDVARVARLRRTLAETVGGDISFGSAHQPIRVAGTIHGKNGRRAEVRLLAQRNHEYELAEVEEAIAAMRPMPGLPAQTSSPARPSRGLTATELATCKIRAGGQDPETRFSALSKVIGHWLRNVRRGICTLDEAWSAVVEYNAARIDPPWDEAKLQREYYALLRKDVSAKGPMPPADPDREVGAARTAEAPELSDDGVAAELVASHGQLWKHVAIWGVWYSWSGRVWTRDEVGGARELARQTCRLAATRASTPSEAKRIASEKKMSAVLRIAAADPAVAVPSSAWDIHSMLLNTPAGVIDLTTGELSDHDPELLITQMTTASPGGRCPRWLEFLGEITDGDIELQAYLARLAGYCLTGSTAEQAFAFLHGHGANGKSVFLQTLALIMGSYAATATLETFMTSRTDRHLTELAGLRAARLVLVPETEAGRSWAEGRIKAVTGGEKLRANFMRQDFFEFEPQFKLLVAGNHRPSLTAVGEAIRRRLQLVPFDVTIPAERRDPRLPKKLLAERDGILGWMLAGCAEWQRRGLAAPKRVQAAAEDYFQDEDLIGQWIAECCVSGPDRRAQSAQLFQSWKSWAEARGHPAASQKALGEGLRSRGFRQASVRRGRGWVGIELRHGPGLAEAGQ